MGYKEKQIIDEMLLNGGPDKRLFRVNSGMGWTGKIIGKNKNTITLLNPRPFHGMPKGTPDIIGWESIKIGKLKKLYSDDDIIAIFIAIEVKTGRVKTTEEQNTFIKTLNKMGGKGCILHE